MKDLFLSVLVRPLMLLALFAFVVIPIEMFLGRVIPEGRLKAVLFDRTLQKRRPWAYFGAWVAVVSLMVVLVALYIHSAA